jgi:hypothetical protein
MVEMDSFVEGGLISWVPLHILLSSAIFLFVFGLWPNYQSQTQQTLVHFLLVRHTIIDTMASFSPFTGAAANHK